jgi:N utilization substance protein B
MAVVDRNILRMAVYELLWQPDVPPKAVINEAIEIAKKFGTTESSRFINGVLDRVLREHRHPSA